MPRLTWCTCFACLIPLKLCLGQNSTKPNLGIWGFTGFVVYYTRPHLNCLDGVVCYASPLAMLTTFNPVGYINERELNKSCGVFFNMQLRCILSST